MIRISRREHDLLRYVQTDDADLSRGNLASVTNVVPESLSRILRSLKQRGLITIERGRHRRILSMAPTFKMSRNVTFYVGNTPRKPFF